MENSKLQPDSLHNGKDIIFADDDTEEVLIFEAALQELNFHYTLRHANSRDSLFSLLKDKRPYILFLDINMPREDGIVCVTEIRNNKYYDQLPIIIYTANTYPKLVDKCFDERANFYIQKASTLDTLRENLNKVFSVDWDKQLHFPPRETFVLL